MGAMTGAKAPFVCALPSAPRSHFPLKGEEGEVCVSSPFRGKSLRRGAAQGMGAGDGC
jgi:hypothetical protein